MPKSIIFVDSRVAGYQSLIDSFSEPAEVFVLDGASDGLTQIATYLQGRTGIDAVHVISHGGQGALYLGSTVLDGGNLASYGSQLARIGGALTETGDILLYGCNVAQGDVGLQFITSLAQYTGADVAASSGGSGIARLGGNWVLEESTGIIDVLALQGSGLTGLLAANTAPTFTVKSGKVTTDVGTNTNDTQNNILIQGDGKIVVGGISGDSRAALVMVRYNTDGSLDTNFDGDGKVVGTLSGFAIAMQPDGKIVSAGTVFFSSQLQRFNVNGSIDSSFGLNGVSAAFGDGAQYVALQPDGKILVAGGSGQFVTSRFNSDGTLDTSFDLDGTVTTNIGNAWSIAVQADNKILVSGSSTSNGVELVLVRYSTNGSLDTTFGTSGIVTTPTGNYVYQGRRVVLQQDGKILTVGSAFVESENNSAQLAVFRYNNNGSVDTTFDSDGTVTVNFISNWSGIGYGLSLQADGKILACGFSGGKLLLTRLNPDGSLDTTFDGDGKVITDFGTANDGARSVAVQSDGKILVSGFSLGKYALARYNTDGSPDTTFGLLSNTLDASSAYTENSSPVVLDTDVQILDTELTAAGSYNGATLTLSRHNGPSSQDVFSATSGGTLSALLSNSYFAVEGVTIGRVTANSAGTLTLTFNSNATQLLVNKAMQQIAYANNSDAPPASVQIDWTFNDGNTGAQGVGGALSVTGSSTVQISAINDSPVLAATLVDQSVTAYIPFNYAVPVNTFTDPDLETLSYSVIMADGTGVPPWLSFNTSTQTFSGTPTTSDVGVLDVQVTAKDRANASVADVFRLTVFPDTVAPTVTTFNPTDEAIRITIGSNIVLTFSEVIVKGTGIVVLKTAAGTTIATYDAATSTNLSVSGTSLTINPTADLAYSTEYKVEFAVGTIKDQAGNSYAGTTSYNFATENGIPTATSVTLSAIEDFAKTGTLTGTDPEGSILTFAKFADPSHGTLTINATTGAYVYTPASNYNGTDSFTFKVNDGTVDSTASTVNITVSAVNDSPVASNASVRTAEDSAFTGTLPTATDVEKDPITYSKASDPAHGTASVAAGGSFTYTPSANYNGADSFGYSVGDGQGGLNTYTANVIISAVNDLPTGTVTITGSALQGQALVAANTLADADGLGVISYQWQAAGVNISGATAGSFTLTQTEVGKAVTVIAAYTDGMGTVEGKTSSATALVVDTTAPTVTTFSPIDEASGIAVGGNIVVTFSEAVQRGIGNITLKTSTGTTIATYDATTSSNLSVSGTSLTINPTADLAYSTEYKVEFAAGTIKDQAGNSYAGTTSYNFATENGIPTATSATVSATEDIVKTGILTGTDPEGSALTFAKVADPSHGTVTINATTGAYVYTPASNYNGPDSFAFKVNDGTVDSVASTVSITVAAVNDIPTGSLNITGTASLGQILTATNTLADADGIGTISYQWKAGGIDILGATASIYTLTQAEVGKVIAVAASYTDALGTAESKTSTPTPAVAVNQTATGSTGNESFTSGAGNDSIDGGAGTDVVVYSESLSSFSLTKTNAGFTVTDSTGAAGTDTLQNIERIKFSDGSIALDVGATQPAGQTAMLLGAVLPGKLAFDASKKALLGAAIDLFDQGFSLQTLSGAVMRLPIWDVLTGTATPTNTDIATYLLTNVNGVAPDATTLANAVTSLNTETDFATQGNFLWHLAESATNQTRIDLVGLASTGLVFTI